MEIISGFVIDAFKFPPQFLLFNKFLISILNAITYFFKKDGERVLSMSFVTQVVFCSFSKNIVRLGFGDIETMHALLYFLASS